MEEEEPSGTTQGENNRVRLWTLQFIHGHEGVYLMGKEKKGVYFI